MDSEEFRNIQIMAIQAVEQPDYEAFYRRVVRWFSEKYSTPLREVDDLPEHDVLQAYFEENYYELYTSNDKDKQQRYDELRDQLVIPPDVQAAQAQDDDDWVAEMSREIRESQEKLAQLRQKKSEQKQEQPMPDLPAIREGTFFGETEVPEM